MEKKTSQIIEVIAPGTKVKIGPKGEIEAVVLSVSLRLNALQYHVAWWSGNERKTEWVEPHELLLSRDESQRIGFAFKGQ